MAWDVLYRTESGMEVSSRRRSCERLRRPGGVSGAVVRGNDEEGWGYERGVASRAVGCSGE
jgi:hypothetical protein